MKRPTNQTAVFAMNQYLVYQQTLDDHKFFNEADKQKLQLEADYWRTEFENAEGCNIIAELGLTTQE